MDSNDPWLMDRALPTAGVLALIFLIETTMIPMNGPAFPDWGTSGLANMTKQLLRSIHMDVSKNKGTPKWMVYKENPIR